MALTEYRKLVESVGGVESSGARLRGVELILAERRRQLAKWGEQRHEMPVWLAILMEEVGELSAAALAWRSGKDGAGEWTRREGVQVAAVAMAILEALDLAQTSPGEWKPGDIETEARP